MSEPSASVAKACAVLGRGFGRDAAPLAEHVKRYILHQLDSADERFDAILARD